MKAIENLMEKKGKFDYILLETTGLADPGPIASMFWLDEGLGSEIYLDGKAIYFYFKLGAYMYYFYIVLKAGHLCGSAFCLIGIGVPDEALGMVSPRI